MKKPRTLKIPVAWLLFPLVLPIWIVRIALALVVGTIRLGECGYKAEILERSDLRGDVILNTKPGVAEWRYGKRYKVKLIPSIGWKLLGEKTETFVCYRVPSLEESNVFDWPEYRLEDGTILEWPSDKVRAISRGINDLLRAAKKKKKDEQWAKWKKAVDKNKN